MSTLIKNEAVPEPVDVKVTDETLSVGLGDGRRISVPLEWFPRLRHGTPRERANYELGRWGIHWPDLDEDIPVEGLLNGERSGESAESLEQWLDYRSRGQKVPVLTLPLPSKLARELRNQGVLVKE
jgi:hypothetical protein